MRVIAPQVVRVVSAGKPFPRRFGEKPGAALTLGLSGTVDAGEKLFIEGNVDPDGFARQIKLDGGHQRSVGKIGGRHGVRLDGVDVASLGNGNPLGSQGSDVGGQRFTPAAQCLVQRPATRHAAREVWEGDSVGTCLAVNECNDRCHALLPLRAGLRPHHFHPAIR